MKHSVVRWLIMFVLVGIVAGCGVTENTDTYNGSTVPWSELLSTAQAEAQKVDPQAVLVEVSVIPEQSILIPSQGHTLSIYFIFRKSSSNLFSVSLSDTNPKETLKLPPPVRATTSSLDIVQEKTSLSNLTKVVLSPANIIHQTLPEGILYLNSGRVSENPALNLILDPSTIEGIATSNPVWSIYYAGAIESLTLYVDAVTGVMTPNVSPCPVRDSVLHLVSDTLNCYAVVLYYSVAAIVR